MAKNDQKNTSQNAVEPQERSVPLKIKLFLLVLLMLAGGYGYYHLKGYFKQEPISQPAASENASAIKLKELENRLSKLESVVKNLPSSAPQTDSDVLPNIEQRLNDFRAEIFEQIRQSLSEQTSVQTPVAASAAKPTAPEVLLASGALIVRDLAEKGLPFAYEAEVLNIMAQNNEQAQKYTETAQKYADSGIRGKEQLIAEFDKIYPTLGFSDQVTSQPQNEPETAAETAAENAAWHQKMWQWIKKIALHHKKKPQPKFEQETDRIYSLVHEARFAEALQLMKTDDNYANINSPVLNEWCKMAQSYLDFESAVSGLIMNSLARIHLKEFEH